MPGDAWLSYVLVLARAAPVTLALAVFTQGFVPVGLALSLSLACVAALAPLAEAGAPVLGGLELALALLRELCIGGAFALALSLALSASLWAVRLSHVRDQPFGLAALGPAYALAAAWLVLSLGGLRAVLLGLAESYRDAGATRVLDARAFALGAAQLAADAFATAFGAALPLVVSLWLLELTLALIARLALFGSPASLAPLRPLLALGAAALLLVPIASRAPELVRDAIGAARALTRAFAR